MTEAKGCSNQSLFKTMKDTFKFKHVVQGTLPMVIRFKPSSSEREAQYSLEA